LIIDRDIRLIPVDINSNIDLVLDIASKNPHANLTHEKLKEALPFVKHTWIGHAHGMFIGVIFLLHFPSEDEWTIDAYRDERKIQSIKDRQKSIDKRSDFSYRGGRAILKWFFENKSANFIFTMHVKENRAATMLCKRLGFEEAGFIQDLIVLKLRREIWALKH